jgi:hypothetical protein
VTTAGFDDFLRAAGRSLTDAQSDLVGPDGPAARIAISELDLDVKVTFDDGEGGALRLRTVTTQDARDLPAGAISSVKTRFVAVAAPEAAASVPVRSADDVTDEVRRREDLQALDRILGGLDVHAVFVPERQRWLATAVDPDGRVVREIVLPDQRG